MSAAVAHRLGRGLARLAALPLFMCGFRPFFLATAAYAVLVLLAWLGFLGAGLVLPAVPGGPLVWHAHELMFGFGFAALAGFLLTAVPEFTATPAFARRVATGLALAWLAARLAFWASAVIGALPAALLNTGFAAALLALLGPRLLRDRERRHLGFLWGLVAMAVAVAGFYVDLLRGEDPMRWLHAAINVMMALVVVAMSRISMRIVNDALDARRAATGDELDAYRARPPRRKLAIFAIALYGAAEFLAPQAALSGWIALAAAAAVLNLLNDWHVGRALLSRWAFMLYAVYWLMAAGYALIGLALLGLPLPPSAGRHLLTVGAMGVSILAVLCIAGRTHAGHALDVRPWVPLAAVLLGAAALLRALSGWPGLPAAALQFSSGLAWVGAFGLAAAYLGAVFLRPRSDGGSGCEEPRPAPEPDRARVGGAGA